MTTTGDGKNAKEISAHSMRDCFSDSKEPHEKRHYKAEDEALDATKAQGRRLALLKHHEKRHFATADRKFEDTHARIF